MKSRHINWLVVLALLPLLMESPYIFRAMSTSPLESWNFIFLFLALAQLSFSLFIGHRKGTLGFSGKPSIACVCLAILSLLSLAIGWHKHIHLAISLSSACLIWSTAGAIYNWATACALLPSCAMFLLGVPSVGFLLGNATGMNGLAVKFILAVIILLLTPLMTGRFRPAPGALLYSVACLTIVAAYGIKMTTGRLAPPMALRLDALSAADFNGTDMEITEADRAFYGGSDIQRYLFINGEGRTIHALTVANVADIHTIHPMAYCLRASGLTLENEQTIAITINGSEAFVHEIIARSGDSRSLHWQWYGTAKHSTADFLLFRSIYSANDDWRMMQISTKVNDTPEEGRELLLHFTKAFGIHGGI